MGEVAVLGTTMHYRSAGAGPPVVFLHGNPTSSHLWRAILPVVGAGRRCIAPDLIGMGASGKPPIEFTLADHIAHVDAFLDALDLHHTVLVAHDWGVAISLDQLRRRPERVAAVAVMEGHLRPLSGWDDFDEGGRELFRRLRTEGVGERMALTENFFLETLLPAAAPTLTAADLIAYRQPYPDESSRRPLLQWPREIPIGGKPAAATEIMRLGWANLTTSPVPKLLLHGEPGVLVTAEKVAMCRAALPALTVTSVGAAGHFLPEDRPGEVAAALSAWLTTT
jgi:haloalkane dehalogenase